MAPRISGPGTCGYGSPGKSPALTRESVWQIPHASTFRGTAPALGSGISRSINSQSPPGLLICAAFIFVLITAPYFLDLVVQSQVVSVMRVEQRSHKRSTKPSGDLDDFSGNPSAIRRRQKSRDRRNILRLPEATERCLCNHLLFKIAAWHPQRVKAFSLDSTWIDGVHANLFWPKFLGQHSGNRTHRTFGRCIHYCRRRRHQIYGSANVDAPAPY